MDNSSPMFVIVTRNHNRYEMTLNFINEINKIQYLNKRIVVVDDGSNDNSGNQLLEYFEDQIDVIFLKKYVEYCIALNYGIKFAIKKYDVDYFFIVNNDTKNFSPNFFKKALFHFSQNNSIGKFGSSVFDYEGGKRGGGELMEKMGVKLVTPTEGYIIPKKVFMEIGLFDESLVRYFEDLDFIKRLYLKDYITFADSSISFDHLGGGTTKNKPFVRNFYRVRNLIWFLKRYGNELSTKQKLITFKGYMKNHYENLISPIKKFKLLTALKVLFSIILGLLTGILIKWKPKI